MKQASLKIIITVFFGTLFFFSSQSVFSGVDPCSEEAMAGQPKKVQKKLQRRCKGQSKKNSYKISNAKTVNKQSRPADVYAGNDKAKLKSMILSDWKSKYPKDKVMGVHFPHAEWKRNQQKTWNKARKSWDYTDKSVLQVSVVVKADSKMATIFPAYINKDNLNGKLRTGVATKSSQYVIRQMLVSNY